MPVISFFAIWLSFLAVSSLAAYLLGHRSHTQGQQSAAVLSAIPFAVLCFVLVALCCAACFGLLQAAALAVPVLGGIAAIALAWLLRRDAARGGGPCAFLLSLCKPGWLLTFGGSAALAVLLAWQQPLLTQWDEFSFWGTAAKVIWQNDTLYTFVQNTNLAARSYPPALPVLGYAFAVFSVEFAPWVVYAAYGVVTFAVFGVLVGLSNANKKAAAFGAVLCVLMPFMAESWGASQQLVAYTTTFADLMLGTLCAGACGLWYALAQKPVLRLAATAAAVAVLGLVKDVGLPLGLVVALVAALDCMFDKEGVPGAVQIKKHRWLCRAGYAVGVFVLLAAVAAAAYMGWAMHLAAVLEQDRSQTGGSANLSTAGMLVAGVKEMLGVDRSEKFTAILQAMLSAFFDRRVSVFGSGLRTVFVIGLLLLLALWLGRRNGGIARVLCFGAASGAGFLGYNFFQLLCYVYVFSDGDGRNLVSYARYMSIWYLFWMLGAVGLLLRAVGEKYTNSDKNGEKYKMPFKNVALLAVTVCVLLCCGIQIDPVNTVLGRTGAQWAAQTQVEQRAQQVFDAVATGSRHNGKPQQALYDEKVLLVSQWDTGERWYRYSYALEPVSLYHAPGSNTIIPPFVETQEPVSEELRLDRENIRDFVIKQGITLLLMDVDDYDFHLEFGPLFTDGMTGFDAGECFVYRVVTTADGVYFTPWNTNGTGVA